jgi:hypothetical protein
MPSGGSCPLIYLSSVTQSVWRRAWEPDISRLLLLAVTVSGREGFPPGVIVSCTSFFGCLLAATAGGELDSLSIRNCLMVR